MTNYKLVNVIIFQEIMNTRSLNVFSKITLNENTAISYQTGIFLQLCSLSRLTLSMD